MTRTVYLIFRSVRAGIVMTPIGPDSRYADSYIKAIVIQRDGKIVAAGSSYSRGEDFESNFGLARYNTNGSLDLSFGLGGQVITPIGVTGAEAWSVGLQPDGKIVAAGDSWNGRATSIALARYHTDGSIDTSFGSGGSVVTPFANPGLGNSVAIQPDGKIVVAFTFTGSILEFAVVRYRGDPLPPVVFIPGIAGSNLVDSDGTTLWPPGLNVSQSLGRLASLAATTPLRATGALRFDNAPGLDEKLGTYGNFLKWMKSSGYVEYDLHGDPGRCDFPNQKDNHPNLFVFPYDWTKSNVDNASLLKSFVQCVSQYDPNSKINIVAHSMGGILARRYILDNPSDHNVDKLITVGTPWLGAPKTIASLEDGLFFGSWIPDFIFGHDLKPVIDRSRAAHQLVPTATYFQIAPDKPFLEQGWDIDLSGNGSKPETYGYDQLVRMLDRRFFFPSIPLLPGTEGKTFQGLFVGNGGQDNFQVNPNGVTYYHIYGKQSYPSTIGQLSSKTTAVCSALACVFYPTFTYKRVDGDGTVPVVSCARNQGLNAPGSTIRQVPSAGDSTMQDGLLTHTGLMQNETVYETIVSYLTGFSSGPLPVPEKITVRTQAAISTSHYYVTFTGIGMLEYLTLPDTQMHRI
jgi:uncharacterized delta-60 repeat protein